MTDAKRPVDVDEALDELRRIGAAESQLDEQVINQIARSAAGGISGDLDHPDPTIPVLPVGDPAESIDRAGVPSTGRRLALAAAVLLLIGLTVAALSQRGQQVVVETPAADSGDASTGSDAESELEPPLVVETERDLDAAEEQSPQTTMETVPVPDPETDPVTTAKPEPDPEPEADPAPEPEPSNSIGTLRLPVGLAGSATLSISDNQPTIESVEPTDGWTPTVNQISAEDVALEFRRESSLVTLTVASSPTSFQIATDREQDGEGSRILNSRTLELGRGASLHFSYDELGLLTLELYHSDGWSHLVSTDAEQHIRITLWQEGSGRLLRTTEIRIGSLEITVETSPS